MFIPSLDRGMLLIPISSQSNINKERQVKCLHTGTWSPCIVGEQFSGKTSDNRSPGAVLHISSIADASSASSALH